MDPERDTVGSPAVLYDLCFGYTKAESLFAGVELGIFEALVEGPLTYPQIAEKLNIPMKHLGKLLNTLCLLKLLDKKVNDEDQELYANSVTTKFYLVKESPECLIDFVKFTALFKDLAGRLTEAVRTGSQQMSKDDNIFYVLENDPEMRKTFQGGMANISRTSRFMLDAFDLSGFPEHVELGGGTGTMARNLKKMYPEKTVSVCDLQRVCDTAAKVPENQDADIKFIPGDFFKGDLPAADMYSMCHVIHDWDDEDASKILNNVYKALRPGGGILILDSVFNDDKVGPVRVNLTELAQIVQHDGKHRTFNEFTVLLEKHGFRDAKLKRWDGFGFYDAIMARKPLNTDN